MASSINASTSGAGGVITTADNTGILNLQTAGTTAVTVNASQNVGIGTTSPDTKLSVYVSGGTSQFRVGNNTNYYWDISRDNATTGALTFKNYNADALTERMRIDSSGNLLFNSGYGSAATAYGCRAWVNFNGTGTIAIRASGNVSSITDNAQGLYTVNFTNSMPDVNYAAFVTANPSKVQIVNLRASGTYSTSAVQVNIFGSDSADYDAPIVNVAVFR